jgi:hypothetical protein
MHDGGTTGCTVFETNHMCMPNSTAIYVGTTGSPGGHFTFISGNNCVNITDINCNTTSSVSTSCQEAALGTMTVIHHPCNNAPPCQTTFPVVCP